MRDSRVFITGFGSVSCLKEDDHFGVLPGEGAVPDQGAVPGQGAQPLPSTRPIPEHALEPYAASPVARRMDRFTLLAYAAVKRALAYADVDLAGIGPERVGLVMNTCYGPLDSTRRYIAKLIRDGARKVPAAVFPNTVHNAFTGQITMELKALGTNSTVSGYNPLCYGLDMIRDGRDDLMIVGGCDELLKTMELSFLSSSLAEGPRAGTCSPRSCFSTQENAFVLGEGAVALVMESEACMRARGATPLAEVLDYGIASGTGAAAGAAFPVDREGITAAMREALRRSGLRGADIDYVSASANGVPRISCEELAAIQGALEVHDLPTVESAKAWIGETLGASSSFSAVLALQAMAQGGAVASGGGRGAGGVRHAMVNGIELGGTVSSLALRHVATPIH